MTKWEAKQVERRTHMDAEGNVPASVVLGREASGIIHLPSWEVCEAAFAKAVLDNMRSSPFMSLFRNGKRGQG